MAETPSQVNYLTAFIDTSRYLRNFILSNPNAVKGYQPYAQSGPVQTVGNQLLPNAFKFHYEGEQSVSCTSDITDHYVENNTAIQDQISLKPIEITTQGFIGDLNNVPPDILQPVQAIAEKLTAIVAYAPALSITAQIAYNTALQLYTAAQNAANAAVEALTGVSALTPQQSAFNTFFKCWQDRIFFAVQTPWAVFPNMAIKSLRPIQSAETRSLTTFEVTFKQINTAQAILIDFQRSQISQNQASTQSAPPNNLGVTQPSVDVNQNSSLSQSFPGSFGPLPGLGG